MQLFDKKLKRALVGLAIAIGTSNSYANNVWQDMPVALARQAASTDVMVNARASRVLQADFALLKILLEQDNVDIELPLPNGQMAVYRFEYSTIAQQALLDKFPEIRTFKATDVNNSANTGRFDISPSGFRAMFRHNGELIFIDPQYKSQTDTYAAYFSRDAQSIAPKVEDEVIKDVAASINTSLNRPATPNRSGGSNGQLLTYRLAVAATGEYTAAFGGTKLGAMSGIMTTINRVNEVFNNDLGVHLELVADNDDLIFTSPSSGSPFTNDSNSMELDKVPAFINSIITTDDYDIGHLFTTSGGGIAFFSSVCDSNEAGLTGLADPTGDIFNIDLVAHEIGHQLGANHTFNGSDGSCVDQRNSATAFEVGSGSTIMAYAGICAGEDIQNNSDPYFHAGSIEEIKATVQSVSCGSDTLNASARPIVDAGNDFTISSNTAFFMSGSAMDTDGDTLRYVWEQLDVGAATTNPAQWIDNGNRTLFRSVVPTTGDPIRFFPNFSQLLNPSASNSNPGGTSGVTTEALPSTDRALKFRLTARDDRSETGFDNAVVTVINTGSVGFVIQTPSAGATWSGTTEEVRWNVAATNLPPISCTLVDILYSSDGGTNFDILLADAVDNNGVFDITTPATTSAQGRVVVRCSDNIFFAVNDANINVLGVVGGPTPTTNPVSAVSAFGSPVTRTSMSTTPVSSSGGGSGGGGSSGVFLFIVLGLLAVFTRQSRRTSYETRSLG
jgi:hypothetical protein